MPRAKPHTGQHKLRDIAAEAGVNKDFLAGAAWYAQQRGDLRLFSGPKGARCTDDGGRNVLIKALKEANLYQPVAASSSRT